MDKREMKTWTCWSFAVKSNHCLKLQKLHKQIHIKVLHLLLLPLGATEFVCFQKREIIFKDAHGIGFIAFFSRNFEEIAKMNNFIFNTDIWHILTCLHTKVVLLTTATFFKYAMNHCISFSLFSCTIATILPSAVLLDFNEDGTRGHTLEFYISSRRGEKKDIWS